MDGLRQPLGGHEVAGQVEPRLAGVCVHFWRPIRGVAVGKAERYPDFGEDGGRRVGACGRGAYGYGDAGVAFFVAGLRPGGAARVVAPHGFMVCS